MIDTILDSLLLQFVIAIIIAGIVYWLNRKKK